MYRREDGEGPRSFVRGMSEDRFGPDLSNLSQKKDAENQQGQERLSAETTAP